MGGVKDVLLELLVTTMLGSGNCTVVTYTLL